MLCEYLAIIDLLEPHVHVKYKEALAGALVNIMHYFNQINDFLIDIILQEISQGSHPYSSLFLFIKFTRITLFLPLLNLSVLLIDYLK